MTVSFLSRLQKPDSLSYLCPCLQAGAEQSSGAKRSMPPQFDHFDGYSVFDDKGEVKRLVESLTRAKDPDVNIERMRKMDFSYVFTLSKKGKTKEVELVRSEIEASWAWRKGNVDEALEKKIRDAISGL